MKKEKGKENKKRRRKRSGKNLDDDVSKQKEKKEHLLDSQLQLQREETFQKLGSTFCLFLILLYLHLSPLRGTYD